MGILVSEQLRHLLNGFLSGGAAGLLFDLARPVRRLFPARIGWFWDLVWLLCTAAWVLPVWLSGGSGGRMFFFPAAALGWAVVRSCLRRPTEMLMARMRKKAAKASGKRTANKERSTDD